MWLDEAPKTKKSENTNNTGVVTCQNGKEIESFSKGIKETKLEKVVLLSTDEELKENSSIEDIKSIIDKTDKIFK
ncbi:MAG: hypothetical protein U0T69_08545 [Chitinophagales bacterium]